jgi:hypothetical protein
MARLNKAQQNSNPQSLTFDHVLFDVSHVAILKLGKFPIFDVFVQL